MLVKNVGRFDRWVRIVIGVAALTGGVIMRNWLSLIGLYPLLSGIFGSCAIYAALGITTCPIGNTSIGSAETDPE